MQRAHYRAVRALVSGSESPDRLVLLNVHTLPLDRGSDGSRGAGPDTDPLAG